MITKTKLVCATLRILGVIQWGLILSTIPCIFVAGLMQHTGWNSEWAPAFLGRDGGGIVGCSAVLEGAFIVWIVKKGIICHYVLPRLVELQRRLQADRPTASSR